MVTRLLMFVEHTEMTQQSQRGRIVACATHYYVIYISDYTTCTSNFRDSCLTYDIT